MQVDSIQNINRNMKRKINILRRSDSTCTIVRIKREYFKNQMLSKKQLANERSIVLLTMLN